MQTPHPADKTVELPCPGSLGLPTDSGSTELRLLSPHPPEDSSQVPNKAFSSLVTRQPSASHSQCAFYFLRDRATSRIKAFRYNSIHASDAAYRVLSDANKLLSPKQQLNLTVQKAAVGHKPAKGPRLSLGFRWPHLTSLR